MKGCVWLVLVFGVATFLEARALVAAGTPFVWPIAAALGFGVMLSVGCIQGVLQSLRRRQRPEDAPANWRDGELVTVSGVLQPGVAAVQAPFSGRAAVYFDYEASAPDLSPGDPDGRARWNGFGMAPCSLLTATRQVPLEGFPSLRHFVRNAVPQAKCSEAAAHHLAHANWTLAPEIGTIDLVQLASTLGSAIGKLPQNLINAAALERLDTRLGEMDATALRARLAETRWTFHECVVEPGVLVTVTGTWHARPPRLDLAYGVHDTHHEIRPGGAEAVATRQVWQALAFSVVFIGSTAAAHCFVHADGGARLQALIAETGFAE